LISGLVAVGGGLAVTRSKANRYDASTFMLITGNGYASAIAGGYNPVDPQRQEATFSDLLTPQLLRSAAQNAGVPATDPVSVATQFSGNSNVMRINATAGNARTAAALANATAQALLNFLKRSDSAQLQEARSVLQRQIKTARNDGDRRVLAAKVNNLDALAALADQQLQIIEDAQVPGGAASRRTARTGAIALVLGLLFGLAVSLLRRRDPALPQR
jgi:hypothetical protein